MTTENDARAWLRANDHDDVADRIDAILAKWRARGSGQRRNWWDVLAGNEAGKPKKVEGVTFPVLAAARRRKGWPECETEVGVGKIAPPPTANRWGARKMKPKSPPTARRRGTARASGTVSAHNGRDHNGGQTSTRVPPPMLTVQNFAQLESIVLPSTDLVVMVGPQATGKSLVLELLKLAIDRNRIVRVLKQHGFKWDKPEDFAALYLGGGFEKSWTGETQLRFGNEDLRLDEVAGSRSYKGEDAVFYIPAHRTLAIAEGWPRPFTQYQPDTPYVARRFSEELLTSLNQGLVGKGKIFPHDRRLKDAFRKLIDEAVYHGATLKLDVSGMRKQFVLEYEKEATLPFMAWTAGQREFTPLLLGLYHLLPPGGAPKRREVQWAIIEEPEMGLHPKAIVAVMAVVLDLLARGYKVALSTHSPTVLEVIWGMSRLRGVNDGPARLCKIMGLPGDKKVLKTASDALQRTYGVVHVQHGSNGRVISKDISHLNPGAADQSEWEWGGLIGFSAKVNEMVANARARR
ncbi:MAG TPA: AAA family ATPase [Kofleriaceae bacterium]|nr:AAA family ATPase [Kofleriaceae bacterium]